MAIQDVDPALQAIGRERALAVRRDKAAKRNADTALTYQLVSEFDDLAPAALRAALAAIERVDECIDTVPIESTLDVQRLANVAEIVHRIQRLASGQSTSNVAHASMSPEERRAHMAQLAQMGDAPTNE